MDVTRFGPAGPMEVLSQAIIVADCHPILGIRLGVDER